ncbi:hypothetical protein [Lutispora sp.]|uniref:hypothetical protein n=1 Tax=Lutispora sp. TaxID=2828727 RepID=UPI0035639D69
MSSRLDKKKLQYIQWWESIGKKLRKVLTLLLSLTLFIQSIIALDLDIIPLNSTIKLEGEAIIESYHYESKGVIRLKAENNMDVSKIKIYINGELIKNEGTEIIDLNVYNDNVIEIDGTGLNKELKIMILDTTENVIFPKTGMMYNIVGNIVTIGRVKLK